ncbi:hypothetical protein LUZ60_005505 [Juncus effusus]|nr:hypothetical protein LUZ60_005505 [Juncus effusus]
MLLRSISLLFLSPLFFQIFTNAKLLNSNCSTTDTYYIGSTFESNLFKLLSSLSTNAMTNSAFSDDSYGTSPDEAYGLIMCYADSSLADCTSCLQYATSNATQPCSMSATATVLYDSCTLSYSRKDFRYVSEPYAPYCLLSGENSLDQNTTKSLRQLMTNLSALAPNSSQMFASGTVSGTNVMGLVQSFPKSLLSPSPPSTSPSPVTSPSGGSKSNSVVIIAVAISVVVAIILATVGICFCRRSRSKTHGNTGFDEDVIVLQDNVELGLEYILNPNAEYQVFDLITLRNATDNFSETNKLGKGGFGPVYKGTLSDGQEIAVKLLSQSSGQGTKEFKNEVDLLAKLRHKNLVQLLGCLIQKNHKMLCYEYLPNGSLDKILFAKDPYKSADLDWRARFKIIEGISRGLHYLHEESRLKIIHRDLKASNILLDKDMNPKISDFGLARFFEEDQTHKDTSVIAGTFGYMAPEYIMHGNFSAKSDVYAFGILVLEIVAGQKNSSFMGSGRISSLTDHVRDEDVMDLQGNVETGLEYILNPNAEYQVFDSTTLKNATDNFSETNKLGKGGFGPVYKGTLSDGQEIAVKLLSGSSGQGTKEFKNEVDLLAKLKHKNLVQLLGCSIQKNQKMLCYEYLPNGSLDKFLFAKDPYKSAELGWRARFKIIEGVCRGLNYLHEESLLKIIHRDLKASNILLDKDMSPKISDFGLARFFEEDQTHKETSVIAGTL